MQGLRQRLARSGLPSRLQVTEHPHSGRNGLYVVQGGGRRWIAKTAASGTEAWFYRQVGRDLDWVPAAPVADDDLGRGAAGRPDGSLTVTEHLGSCPPVHEVAADDPGEALSVLVSAAPRIAELHGAAPPGEVPAARPPLPRLDPAHVSAWIDGTRASIHLLRHIQSRPRLTGALRAAREAGGPRGLVHGDLKADNILRGPDGPVVIDWELCGTGAVAWDLGSLIGSMLAIWTAGIEITGGRPASWFEGAAVPYGEVAVAATRFLADYRRHTRGEMPDRAEIAAAVAAWLVARSWMESSLRRDVNALHLLRLVVAEGVVRNPRALLRTGGAAPVAPAVPVAPAAPGVSGP